MAFGRFIHAPLRHIHCLYDDATIDPEAYARFSQQLNAYLSMELNLQLFANFLRSFSGYQKHFQVCRNCHGQAQFLKAEVLFHYEHGSHFRVADDTFDKLLEEVSGEDYIPYEIQGRIRCDELNDFLSTHINLQDLSDCNKLVKFLSSSIPDAQNLVDELVQFVHTQAKLPDPEKNFSRPEPITFAPGMTRAEVIETIVAKRSDNPVADLALYAYRDMALCDWEPFVKAAFQRSPVSIAKARDMSIEQVYAWLLGMHNKSIYDGNRLAQPDEVVNFKTGDGIEKALVLANIAYNRGSQSLPVNIVISKDRVLVTAEEVFCFPTRKKLEKTLLVSLDGQVVVE